MEVSNDVNIASSLVESVVHMKSAIQDLYVMSMTKPGTFVVGHISK